MRSVRNLAPFVKFGPPGGGPSNSPAHLFVMNIFLASASGGG